jgi:transcriptional regulator with XRE-family HTH domain
MSRASTLVRVARKSRSLSQADLAKKAHIHQSTISVIEDGRDLTVSTLEKLLKATGYGLLAVPTRRADAAEVSTSIRSELGRGNTDRAFRALLQLNDNLVSEHGLLRGVLGLSEPPPTGHTVWDAALAGLVAWRLTEENIPLPAWIEQERFFLARPQTLEIDSADPVPALTDVPPEFARRGVLVWEDTFRSV